MSRRTDPTRPRIATGYTLVEVLIVVTILGVVSAVVVPGMLTAGSMGVQAAARIIVADILYAQNEAIAAQATRKVVFEPANNRYEVQDENGYAVSAKWINGSDNNYIVDFSDDDRFQGVTIQSADFAGLDEVQFDDLGAPVSGGNVTIQYNDATYRISVAAFTGRVTVTKL